MGLRSGVPAASPEDASRVGTVVGRILRTAWCLAWSILVGAALHATVPATAGEPFAVVREEVHVLRGDRVVAPVAIRESRSPQAPDAGVEWEVDRNRIRGRDPATGAQRWTSRMPAGRRLEVLARSSTTLFARWWKRGLPDAGAPADAADARTAHPPAGPEAWVVDDPESLRRLSLEDGRWLEPLPVPGGRVRSVLCDERGVVVVSDPGPDRYRLTAFEAGKGTSLWSRDFRSGPRHAEAPSYASRLAALSAGPGTTSREVVPAGDRLLLCAGASQELLEVDRATGETMWEIERIWEFERYQERPNLFAWYVRRAVPPERRHDAARRCRIVSGPFVVGSGPARRVFVAVTRGREEGTGAPVPEGVTYEIEAGQVASVTRLPRPVLEQGSATVGGGVLWRCDHDAIAFQVPSHQENSGFNGMDSTDRCGALRWYREPSDPPPVEAWLTTAVREGEVAVGADAAYAAVGGGFVRAPEEKAFRVRLRRVDLETGAETESVLVVPFTGDLPSWEEANRTTTGSEGAPTRVEIMHAWGVWTGALEVRGDRLEIEVVPQGQARFRVVFPVEALR